MSLGSSSSPNPTRTGLSTAEAERRLSQYGPNVFGKRPKLSAGRLLLKQFESALIYLLLIAAALSFILRDYYDGLVILVILLLNTGLGFLQEYKSGKAVEKLQGLLSRSALVIRDGTEALIDERCLVPGDLVVLKEGDIAPADLRLTESEHLSTDESQLTGESVPVNKAVGAVVYAGSTVAAGEGIGTITVTGLNTQLGKIAHLSASTKKVTQYQQSLTAFSTFLMKMSLFSLSLVFILKLIADGGFSHFTSLALFIVALSITVVPEALPVIATVTLSNGAMKLAQRHVIAKTLSAVEDLGNINILCTDKTGTLTENKQTVKTLTSDDDELFQLLTYACLDDRPHKGHRVLADPFDEAFRRFIPAAIQKEAGAWVHLDELPFDPAARRHRVVVSNGHKTYLVSIGSVDTLLTLSSTRHKRAYLKQIEADEANGLRHLGLAYKQINYTKKYDLLANERDLTFLGFVSLEDPLRPTTKHTIGLAEQLGVTIKILSGDSVAVTSYVAREVGLLAPGGKVYSGEELDQLSDEEASAIVLANGAFARLNPEQKYRIIKLLKHSNNVVGYQGDGINDAPALKLADVAIAVNTATDVAKENADILLLRSDLSVIVGGIKYGRTIFTNINKYIRYTMIGNFGNFFALSALYLLALSLPMLAIQLLITNLLTDIPLVAISTDNVRPEELTRPSKNDTHSLMFISLVLGSVTALFEIMFFAVVRGSSVGLAQTGLFLFLTVSGLVVIFSVRNRGHYWRAPHFSAPLFVSFVAVLLASIGMLYWNVTQKLFSFTPLPVTTLAIVLGMAVVYVVVLDVVKVWFYRLKLAV
jgi:Mg2+-importing ATPase